MKRILGVPFLMLAACAGPNLATRVEVPSPPPKAIDLGPNPSPQTDEPATQRWLDREVARLRGVQPADRPAEPQQPEPTPQPVDDETHVPEQPTTELRARPDLQATRTDEAATQAWLEQAIEQRNTANPNTPPVPLQQIVERRVYVDRPYYGGYRPYYYHGVGYDEWGYPQYEPYYDSYYSGVYGPRSTFPINTAVGAGIGAIIGHQSGHKGEGAAIGAGVGLLLDLWR